MSQHCLRCVNSPSFQCFLIYLRRKCELFFLRGGEAVIVEVILKLVDEGKVVSRITTAETTTIAVAVAGAPMADK